MSSHKDFFISYTGVDRQWAEWIAWQLEEAGYTAVLQAWDFRPGMSFIHMMDDALKKAKCTIAVLSPDYFRSNFATSEWEATFQRDPTGELGLLMPVRVRECNDIEGLLGTRVYIDLVGQDEQSARSILLEGVIRGRTKPEVTPAFPGNVSHIVAQRPRFPGVLPPRIWTLPFEHNPAFTGREDVLQQMYEALHIGQMVALVPPLTLTGLGGIGKTQTAVEYAYRYLGDYTEAIIWIRAETNESLTEDFLALAEKLSIPVPRREEQDQQPRDLTAVIDAVKRWLETHDRWLLVFDNVEEMELIQRFRPVAPRGHIILTTRVQAVRGKEVTCVTLEEMAPEEGALFLLRRAGIIGSQDLLDRADQTDRITATTISEQLDGLPLALDQAGAYIEETGCSLSRYLNLYREQQNDLLKQRGQSVGHPAPVTATFLLAFEKIEQTNGVAADLLRLCVFLSPDAISTDLIINRASYSQRLQFIATYFHEAMRELCKYSLLKPNREETKETFTIHRLVQEVLKVSMSEEDQRQWIIQAIQLFQYLSETDKYLHCFSWCSSDLEPHIDVFVKHIQAYGIRNSTAAYLLVIRACNLARQAYDLLQRGTKHEQRGVPMLDATAKGLLEDGLAMIKQIKGPTHRWVAQALVSFAEVMYLPRNRYAEAYSLYKKVSQLETYLLEPENSSHTYNSSADKYLQVLLHIGRRREATALIHSLRTNKDIKMGIGHLIRGPGVLFLSSFLPVSSLVLPIILGGLFRSWIVFGASFLLFTLLGMTTVWYFYNYGYLINKKWEVVITKTEKFSLAMIGACVFMGIVWASLGWSTIPSLWPGTHLGILAMLLSPGGALVGFLFGGFFTAFSSTSLLENFDDPDSLPALPPLFQAFHTLNFLSVFIAASLAFQSWFLPIEAFLLSFGSVVLVALITEEFGDSPLITILYALIFFSIFIALSFTIHLWLVIMIGSFLLSIALGFLMETAIFTNKRIAILLASSLYSLIWSVISYLTGRLIFPSIHIEMISLLGPYVLAFIGLLAALIGHLRTYDWINYLLGLQ